VIRLVIYTLHCIDIVIIISKVCLEYNAFQLFQVKMVFKIFSTHLLLHILFEMNDMFHFMCFTKLCIDETVSHITLIFIYRNNNYVNRYDSDNDNNNGYNHYNSSADNHFR